MPRGDTRTLSVAAKQSDGTTPQDLTDVDLWFTAKRWLSQPDADAVITKDLTDGLAVTDAPAGLAEVSIDPEDTSDLTPSRVLLHWDLQGRDADGTVVTLAQGKLRILADVTLTTTPPGS
jgi:hypothetical protein